MEEPEVTRRNLPHRGKLAKEVASELLDMPLSRAEAVEVVDTMDNRTLGLEFHKYHRPGEDAKRYKAQKKHQTRKRETARKKERRQSQEELFAELMRKLRSGDPSHPDYERRTTAAKKYVRKRESLPYIAKMKWSNPHFRESMMNRGFKYDVAECKGWLPFESAKEMQKKWIGARSRGEYEVFIKLFGIHFLPTRPDHVYTDTWKGWSDFLDVPNVFGIGGGMKAVDKSKYLPFHEALTIARSLKLKTVKAWQQACREGRVPLNVPMDPHAIYPDQYVSINHWLGVDNGIAVVSGELGVTDLWVMYSDQRELIAWWAKMKADAFHALKQTEGVTILRTYQFEGNLANDVWDVIDRYSEILEEDMRERCFDDTQSMLKMMADLDAILLWARE